MSCYFAFILRVLQIIIVLAKTNDFSQFLPWFSAIDLIKRLLKVDMTKRIGVTQSFLHPWIKEV